MNVKVLNLQAIENVISFGKRASNDMHFSLSVYIRFANLKTNRLQVFTRTTSTRSLNVGISTKLETNLTLALIHSNISNDREEYEHRKFDVAIKRRYEGAMHEHIYSEHTVKNG